MITTVIKRDGKTVPYDISFIKNAISKANVSLEKETSKISEDQINEVVSNIDNNIKSLEADSINIESIQDVVQNSLIDKKYYDLVNAYISYRAERTRIRENKTDFMTEIIGKANPTEDTIANQNANVDEMSFGGRKGEADSVLMRKLALDHMSKKHRDNHLNNRIYIHDLDSYYVGESNCLSVPFDDILKTGLEFRNTDLRPARSINTAFQLYMVTFQSQSLQQFGGVAGTHIDTTSIPYFRISFNKNYKSVQNILPFCKVNETLDETKSILDKQYTGGFWSFRKKYIHKKALQMTIKELNQAAEGMYHNANSLLSRSGNQLPFTSINYGLDTSYEGQIINEALIDGCMKGVGKTHRTSIFPCGIFQYMKGVNDVPGTPNYYLKKKAISSTVRRFYPNYVNGNWSVQTEGIKKDRELKYNVIEKWRKTRPMDYEKLCSLIEKDPEIGRKLNLSLAKTKFDDYEFDKVLLVNFDTNLQNEFEVISTMGAVKSDSKVSIFFNRDEAIYKVKDAPISDVYKKLLEYFEEEDQFGIPGNKNKDIDLRKEPKYKEGDYTIWDNRENRYVKLLMMNKNVPSGKKYTFTLKNGMSLTCTFDHPLFVPNQYKELQAKDINIGDWFYCEDEKGNLDSSEITNIELSEWDEDEFVYDVTTETGYFTVNGIWSHNCRTYNGFDINFDEKYFEDLLLETISQGKLPNNYLYSAMQKDGRGNIAPNTIILPTIAMEAKLEAESDPSKSVVEVFMTKLEEAIEDSRDELIERFEHIASQPAAAAKFMYENNTMKGYIPYQGIRSALKHGTLAIGQIGLAECLYILIGCDQTEKEGLELGIRIEKLFKSKCDYYKKEYKLNFGVYYTPAENLCYTSYKKFVKKYGLIENVTAYRDEETGELKERGFLSNSIHVPVWKNVDPFTKIDIESQLTGYSSAGCITYVELENAKFNEKSVEQILDYAMSKDIPYMAFNVSVDNCLDCGFIDEDAVFASNGDKCPKCNSERIEKPRRVTGYLTGDYRVAFNKGKQDETNTRVKHTRYLNKFNNIKWKTQKHD